MEGINFSADRLEQVIAANPEDFPLIGADTDTDTDTDTDPTEYGRRPYTVKTLG